MSQGLLHNIRSQINDGRSINFLLGLNTTLSLWLWWNDGPSVTLNTESHFRYRSLFSSQVLSSYRDDWRRNNAGEYLFAIEPWKELLTAYLDRDVGAYIGEVRKPSKPTAWDLEWIGIDRRSSVYRAYQHQDMGDGEDFTAWLNRERIPLTNLI